MSQRTLGRGTPDLISRVTNAVLEEEGGGGGADKLHGGVGRDEFRFVSGAGWSRDVIEDFDLSGDDVIRLNGFTFGSADPDDLSVRESLRAVEDATTFNGSGATIDLEELGGTGEIRLIGVEDLSFRGTEDFLFG